MNNKYGPAPRAMDFGEAIGTCLKKYFVFEGRASKSEFWYFFLVYTVGSILLSFIARAVMSAPLLILAGLVTYGTIIPMISAGCRRLHDIGKSGWWQCIPIYNLILWAEDSSSGTPQRSSSQPRDYSEAPRSRSRKNDLTDELEELQELYEDGTLSETQFKKAKEKLLK